MWKAMKEAQGLRENQDGVEARPMKWFQSPSKHKYDKYVDQLNLEMIHSEGMDPVKKQGKFQSLENAKAPALDDIIDSDSLNQSALSVTRAL